MLSDKMTKALNGQINRELYSAYLYLGMSAHSAHVGMPGVANWFYVQTQEELGHVQRFYQYIVRQGAKVELETVQKPTGEFASALDMFSKALEHERFITKSINELVDVAVEQRDHASEVFLQWFVNEQVEEEENACNIIDQLKLAGDVGSGLFMIDRELATRTYTPPPPVE